MVGCGVGKCLWYDLHHRQISHMLYFHVFHGKGFPWCCQFHTRVPTCHLLTGAAKSSTYGEALHRFLLMRRPGPQGDKATYQDMIVGRRGHVAMVTRHRPERMNGMGGARGRRGGPRQTRAALPGALGRLGLGLYGIAEIRRRLTWK
jgi:hypothetical protein